MHQKYGLTIYNNAHAPDLHGSSAAGDGQRYGYQSREAILHSVRGLIDLLSTERHRLLERGKVTCQFDELTINTARNRFVRAALEAIAKVVVRQDLPHRCRSLAASLRRMGVIGERPQLTWAGRHKQFGSRFYRFPIQTVRKIRLSHKQPKRRSP